MLEGPLVREARSLLFVAVGAPALVIHWLVEISIVGLAVVMVVVMVLLLVCSLFALLSQLFESHAPSTVKSKSTPLHSSKSHTIFIHQDATTSIRAFVSCCRRIQLFLAW